jgi:hypothetical protein
MYIYIYVYSCDRLILHLFYMQDNITMGLLGSGMGKECNRLIWLGIGTSERGHEFLHLGNTFPLCV